MNSVDSTTGNDLQKMVLSWLNDGKLNFNSAALNVSDLTDVLDEVLGTHEFPISGAVVVRESEQLVISGSGSFLDLEKVDTTVIITNDPDSELSVFFKPTPPADWDLFRVFAGSNQSPLQSLPLSHSEFTVICAGDGSRPTRVRLSGRLAEFNIDGMSFERDWHGNDCKMSWKAGENLQIPGIGNVSLDDFNCVLDVSLFESTFRGAIGAKIHTGAFVLPLVMSLPSGGEALLLRGDFESVPLSGLADVAEMLGMDLAAMNIPSALANLENLTISDFEILLNPRNAEIIYVAVELCSSAEWSIIPDTLVLEKIKLGFNLFSPTGAKRSLQGTIRSELNIAGLTMAMRADIGDVVTLYGHIPTVSLKKIGMALIPVDSFWEVLPEFTLENVIISISSSTDFEFSSSEVNLDLVTVAETMNITLPDGIRDISLNQFSISHSGQDNLSRVEIGSDAVFFVDSETKDRLRISNIATSVEYRSASEMGLQCSFRLDGSVTVSPELSVVFNDVQFSWDQAEKCWSVQGSAIANILGAEYPLVVAVEVQGSSQSISLHYPADLLLTDLGGAGSVVVHNLALLAVKTGESSKKSMHWQISGNARITIDHLFEAEGVLVLKTGNGENRLELSAKAPLLPPITLPLGFPDDPELHLSLDDVVISYVKHAESNSAWSLQSAARLQIVGIPPLLNKYLPPETLSGHFFADGKTVGIGFDVPSTLQPEFPELALTFANDYKLTLGRPGLIVMAIELQIGEQPKLLQKLRVSLPPQLNNIFGLDKNDKPHFDLFNKEFDLQLIMAKRLGLKIETSPLKPLEFYQIAGDDGQWTKWDFGNVGKVEFRVPEFAWQGGAWKASCGFHRLTEIGLPLKPVRFLLEKCGFPGALLKAIPDTLPLKDIDLTGDNFGSEMKLLLGDDVLGRLDNRASLLLKELFDAITKVIKKLPVRLQDYLQIRIPTSLILEVSVDSTGGGTSMALRTRANDPPLKFLLPLMLGVPELVGMSLHGFSFGQKMGGALALLEFDGEIDRFDMVSLITALALDKKDISNHYILDKTLFVVPTAFPVPIPLFFNNLSLDYRDILGFNIQANWSCPDPQLDVFKTISLFSELFQFFKEPDYLLQNENFAETLGLKLTIGENFITLPSYLGSRTLGLHHSLPTLSLGDSVARFLDFLKTGNAGYAITAIPLQHDGKWIRIGSKEIHFGPLGMGMSWCITTEQEFVHTIIPASRQNDKLPISFDHAVLDSLPKKNESDSFDKGFIILLMGRVGLGSIAGLRTEFGMAITATGGFETGFRLMGEIGGELALRISGAIHANEEKVTIKGSTGLFWHDKPLIASSGLISVSETALEVNITIELGPSFSLTGLFVVGKQGLLMDGKAAWDHGADGPSEGIAASVQFDRDGMLIAFDWNLAGLDGDVHIQVPGDGDANVLGATVVLKPDMALQQAFVRDIKDVAKSASEETVDGVYHDLQNAIGAVETLELSISGLRSWLPQLCDEIITTIKKNIEANTNGWKRPGRSSARKQAQPFIDRLAVLRDVAQNASDKTIRAKLKAALQDVIDHNNMSVTVGIPSVKWKKKGLIRYPVYYTRKVSIYSRKLMDSNQLKQLQQGCQWIEKLPGANGFLVDTQHLYDQLPNRDKLLGEIHRDLQNNVESAAPQIESIGFATSLGVLDIGKIEATVIYRRCGKDYIQELTLDFSNPERLTQQLVDAFGRK